MKIESINIIESKNESILACLKKDTEIKAVFNNYKYIEPGEIFEFNDSVYNVDKVSLILIDETTFEIQVEVTFESLISNVPQL
jgi:hypothetical protein